MLILFNLCVLFRCSNDYERILLSVHRTHYLIHTKLFGTKTQKLSVRQQSQLWLRITIPSTYQLSKSSDSDFRFVVHTICFLVLFRTERLTVRETDFFRAPIHRVYFVTIRTCSVLSVVNSSGTLLKWQSIIVFDIINRMLIFCY